MHCQTKPLRPDVGLLHRLGFSCSLFFVSVDEVLADLHLYLAEHGEQSKGKIVYDLERDFHVTGEELRRPFAFYFERFPVQVEVK